MKHDFLLLDDIEKGIGALYPPDGGQITLQDLNIAIDDVKKAQNMQLMILIGIVVLLLSKK